MDFNTILRQYAQLLSRENIKVQFDNSNQPRFDVKNRTLVLPNMKINDAESLKIMKMYVAHEVGHAIFTTKGIVEENQQKVAKLMKYANILEDIRIEKKMKKLYAGLTSQFYAGYEAFFKENVGEFSKRKLNQESLIDRINSYAKIGEFEEIKFTKEEQEIVDKSFQTETLIDVIKLAEYIYNLEDKQESQEDQDDSQDNQESDENQESKDGQGDGESGDQDNQESDENQDESENDDSKKSDEKSSSQKKSKKSTKDNKDAKDDSQDDNVEEGIIEKLLQQSFVENFSSDAIRDVEFEDIEVEQFMIKDRNFDDYFKKYNISKNYLVQQDINSEVNMATQNFNMFKAARRRLNTRKFKSGDLDVDLLYKHKVSDDVFRTNEIKYNEENHGFVFLLDYSGSMDNTIREVMKQVFILCLFAKRNNIPFEVYCFTKPKKGHFSEYSLYKIFNSDLTETELKMRYNSIFDVIDSIGSTPLVDSCHLMTTHLENFKKRFPNRKLSYIILSDGAEKHSNFIVDVLTYKSKQYDVVSPKYVTYVDIAKDIGYNTIGYFLVKGSLSSDFNGYLKYLGTSVENSKKIYSDSNLIAVTPNLGFDTAFVIRGGQSLNSKKVFLQHFIKEMS